MPKAKSSPITSEEVSRALRQIGRLELERDATVNRMNGQIDQVKAHFLPILERRQAAIAEAALELRLRSEDSRESLLLKGAKTLKVLFGLIRWRKQGEKLRRRKGISEDDVVGRILSAGRAGKLLRQKLELDMPAVKAAVANGLLPERDLRSFGLHVVPAGEDWSYEVDREKVRQDLGDLPF